jgi:hypothetical protein
LFIKKSFKLKEFFYQSFETKNLEVKNNYQNFGIIKGVLNYNNKRMVIGSMHLPVGFSSKERLKSLLLAKKIMNKSSDVDLILYGGDCNFCFSGEIKRASEIVKPENVCITKNLGYTLNSYYTEREARFSWVKINNFLRSVGIKLKFKTDHLFLDKNNLNNVVSKKILY